MCLKSNLVLEGQGLWTASKEENLIFPLATMKDFKDPPKEMKEIINRVR